MNVINEDLLNEFRKLKKCEFCGYPCKKGIDPHHIHTKGAGRLDISCNLIGLCRLCHIRQQESSKDACLAIAAKREGTTPEAIVELIHWIRRASKNWDLGLATTEMVWSVSADAAIIGRKELVLAYSKLPEAEISPPVAKRQKSPRNGKRRQERPVERTIGHDTGNSRANEKRPIDDRPLR